MVINLGTNDNNSANNVSAENYYRSYVKLVEGVHEVWPKANIVLMVRSFVCLVPITAICSTDGHIQSLWNGFYQSGTTYKQSGAFVTEIYAVYSHFNNHDYLASGKIEPFVYYFNSTGILQHNDIGPQWHPTDVGYIKLASHMMQYIKNTFGWEFAATGPEVQHEMLYWNNEVGY